MSQLKLKLPYTWKERKRDYWNLVKKLSREPIAQYFAGLTLVASSIITYAVFDDKPELLFDPELVKENVEYEERTSEGNTISRLKVSTRDLDYYFYDTEFGVSLASDKFAGIEKFVIVSATDTLTFWRTEGFENYRNKVYLDNPGEYTHWRDTARVSHTFYFPTDIVEMLRNADYTNNCIRELLREQS